MGDRKIIGFRRTVHSVSDGQGNNSSRGFGDELAYTILKYIQTKRIGSLATALAFGVAGSIPVSAWSAPSVFQYGVNHKEQRSIVELQYESLR